METKGGSETLFTKRHLKLLNMARLSEIAAWIFMGISMLSVFSNLTSYLDLAKRSDIYYDFILLTPALMNFVKNLAVFVAVLGISMGLRMIVETDVNYRLRKQEDSDVQQ